MQLNWVKCQSGNWCGFLTVGLDHEHFNDLKGVYIIWSGDKVVRLGSGIIKNRLAEHRENKEITKYPDLRVTWAQVNANQMKGVEKFLADKLDPLVGERFPDRTQIPVNLPQFKQA
ncbi:hypothetical protein L3V59_36275 [Burkholderia aenigmatica]|uniref:hypothetical protein n=1 Tax=Burkholderia aenigmatica TaxID=2015348 RepID=UPI001F460A23|nr:hypothetical protein [Burkholderia aenigmatica]UKD17403.1 hypothetical protein L3V59_36275 [Burkholderia aenigmatica]